MQIPLPRCGIGMTATRGRALATFVLRKGTDSSVPLTPVIDGGFSR